MHRAGTFSRVEKLAYEHEVRKFNCGKSSLDEWLRRFVLTNQLNDSARTYVSCRGSRVVGYYSLSAGSVRKEESPERIGKGLARHPIGVILLARLAVDRTEQGSGLGKFLLADALKRCAAAADEIGARAILVHALDDDAAKFYERFGFDRSPLEPRQSMLLMKDLRATLKAAR